MKALWELILRSVPAPLRTTLIVVLAFLVLYVQATKIVRQMEYRDVLLDYPFIICATVALVALAVQFFRYLKRPWSWIGGVALSLLAIFASVEAWGAYHYVYNEQGFFNLRHWVVTPSASGDPTLSMQIVAASNTPGKLVIQVETLPTACPGVVIKSFRPVLPVGMDVEGAETIEPQPNVRQFTFEHFRRPESVVFHLTLSHLSDSVAPQHCFTSSATSDTQSKGESVIGGEEK